MASRKTRGIARIATAAVVACAAAVALTGCSTGVKDGAAAVVDGHRITVSQVQSAAEDLAPLVGSVQPQTALVYLILDPALEQQSKKAGLNLSDQDLQSMIENTTDQTTGKPLDMKVSEMSPSGKDAMHAVGLMSALQNSGNTSVVTATIKQTKDNGVEVNPRYGSVDLSTGTVSNADFPWLAQASTEDAATSTGNN